MCHFTSIKPHSFPCETSPSISDQIFDAVPVEGITFLIASLAIRLFTTTLSSPLFGIGISIIVTRLVLKAIDRYDNTLLINLTKTACKFNKEYPTLQLITFICALAFSFLSGPLSFVIGACLGSFGSVMLDVEHYKKMQQANRNLLLHTS